MEMSDVKIPKFIEESSAYKDTLTKLTAETEEILDLQPIVPVIPKPKFSLIKFIKSPWVTILAASLIVIVVEFVLFTMFDAPTAFLTTFVGVTLAFFGKIAYTELTTCDSLNVVPLEPIYDYTERIGAQHPKGPKRPKPDIPPPPQPPPNRIIGDNLKRAVRLEYSSRNMFNDYEEFYAPKAPGIKVPPCTKDGILPFHFVLSDGFVITELKQVPLLIHKIRKDKYAYHFFYALKDQGYDDYGDSNDSRNWIQLAYNINKVCNLVSSP